MTLGQSTILRTLDHISMIGSNVAGKAMGAITGVPGAQLWVVTDALPHALSITDAEDVDLLLRPWLDVRDACDWAAVTASLIQPVWQRLSAGIRKLQIPGVSTIGDYAVVHNVGPQALGQALLHVSMGSLIPLLDGEEIAPQHLFRTAWGASPLGVLSIPSGYTQSTAILSTEAAGGMPYASWTGVAGGPVTITVTGDGYDYAANQWFTGRTWTATIPDGSGAAALTPGTAPSVATICRASACTRSGGTAGTIRIEARPPSGRLDVPWS